MILTESDLRVAAQEVKSKNLEKSYISESTRFDAVEVYDLFISHSFSDKDLVLGLKYKFKQAGYKVYIDWIDDSNLDRRAVTVDTAKIIKKRIEDSKGLAYIATSNITNSKWCPWELGVSDGYNGMACILPIIDSRSFKGQEYLGLYPFLDFDVTKDTKRHEVWVTDQNNVRKYITLREWLAGRTMTVH